MERMAIASSITTGRFSIAPRPRMATLGWLITGKTEQPAENAGVGDRKRALGDFLRLELFRSGAHGEIVQRARQSQEILLLGVLDHRDDQAPIQRHGDADVAFLVQDDVGAVGRGVHRRKGAQGLDSGADEERHEGELGAGLRLELVFHFGAQRGNAADVHFLDGIDVRRNALREHHVLGDALPHDGHGLHFVMAEIHPLARHG